MTYASPQSYESSASAATGGDTLWCFSKPGPNTFSGILQSVTARIRRSI